MPIFIENCKYLGKDVNAMTVGPFVFCKPGVKQSTRNHELIHCQQGIETLYIGLWIIYAYDYIKGLAIGKDSYDAYMSTRAEIEAYANQNNPRYLSQRKRYQWIFPKDSKDSKVSKVAKNTKSSRTSKRLLNMVK